MAAAASDKKSTAQILMETKANIVISRTAKSRRTGAAAYDSETVVATGASGSLVEIYGGIPAQMGNTGMNDGTTTDTRLVRASQPNYFEAMDANSFILMVTGEQDQTTLYDIADQWWAERPRLSAEAKQAGRRRADHPMGPMVPLLLVEAFNTFGEACCPGDCTDRDKMEQRAYCKAVANIADDDWYQLNIHNFAPTHMKPMDGSKWVWELTLYSTATTALRTNIAHLCGTQCTGFAFDVSTRSAMRVLDNLLVTRRLLPAPTEMPASPGEPPKCKVIYPTLCNRVANDICSQCRQLMC
jgi:hypothetical protein